MQNRKSTERASTRKDTAPWAVVCAALAAIAAFLRFALRGYDVLAYILLAVVALILIRVYLGGIVWKLALGAAVLFSIAICLTQVPIVGAAHTDASDDVKYLVVLGARVNEDGQPSYSLRYRLEATLSFMEAHPGCVAILSGGRGKDEVVTEASCMYGWLVGSGIDPGRLILEERAENTWQNLEYSFAIIRERGDDPNGCTAVVSSNYHLCRAKLMASKLGVDVTGISAYSGNPFLTLNYFIREAPALWKAYLLD